MFQPQSPCASGCDTGSFHGFPSCRTAEAIHAWEEHGWRAADPQAAMETCEWQNQIERVCHWPYLAIGNRWCAIASLDSRRVVKWRDVL